MTSYKESLVSSKISYNDFKKSEIGRTVGELLNDQRSSLNSYLKGKNSAWRKDLESMKDWKLINFQSNTPSGFSAAAFQKPDGEIVIAFRGTEPDRGLFRLFADLKTDAEIAAAIDDKLVKQFDDAKQFVCQTMEVKSLESLSHGCKLSLTGHSLGGGLAQYIAYHTRYRKIEATTFNAVGVGQCLGEKGGSDTYSQIKNYCDSWDVIGNYGTPLGEKIYTQNNQRLDGPELPRFHSPLSYVFNPMHFLEDHWNYKTYQFNVATDYIADTLKKELNTRLPWAPYSHGLEGFRDKWDENGHFDKTYQAARSEVEFTQMVSSTLFYAKKGSKAVDSAVDQIITKFVEQRTPKAKIVDQTQSKPGPQDSFIWPKWSTSEQTPRDFLAVSAQMKQSNLAKDLGYSSYNLLINNSELCGEKSGVKLYSTEHPVTGKVVLWDNRSYKPLMEFADRKSWESAPVQEHFKQHLNQTPTKTVASGKSGMGR